MGGYKRYIVGVYYHDSKLRKILDKEGRQNTFEALRKGYPLGRTFKELVDTGLKSAFPNCDALHKENIVKTEEVPGARRRPATKYYFEDYNYIDNKKENFRFPFAPGYVQYTEEFLDNYKKLNEEFRYDIHQIYLSLINILKHAVSNEKQMSTRQLCKFCGYDHEMRDFIRATLLHLIDGIEEHPQFIGLVLNEGIVSKAIYEQLKTEIEHTPSQVNEQKESAKKELMKERQSTRLMENGEQAAKHATPHKQYKTKRHHTEEWKRLNSLRMKGYRHLQEDIEKMRWYQFDHYAFDKLNADAKYWIGYIMARGSMPKRGDSPNSPTIKISVPEEDRNHLDRFKEFIKSNHPVRHHEKKHIYELEFRSSRIRNELERYGIRSKMRYHERVIILEHDKDFWRGFIDANASGKSGKFEISRYGKITLRVKKGHELILQFKTFAENILGHSISEADHKIKNWSLTITDGNAVEFYLKLLYDKNSIALDGNLKKIEQILSLPEYKTKTFYHVFEFKK